MKTLNLATIEPQKMVGGFNPSKFALKSKYQFKTAEKEISRTNTLGILRANDEQERLKRYSEMLI